MRSRLSSSCWRSKHSWCSPLNDMSPAGVPRQLEVSIVEKFYRAESRGRLEVLRALAFKLAAGTVGALVGPSGCGKTTLVRIITGLDSDYSGVVRLPDHGKLGM